MLVYGHIILVSKLHSNSNKHVLHLICKGAFSSTGVTYSAMSALPTVITFTPENNGQVVSLNVYA